MFRHPPRTLGTLADLPDTRRPVSNTHAGDRCASCREPIPYPLRDGLCLPCWVQRRLHPERAPKARTQPVRSQVKVDAWRRPVNPIRPVREGNYTLSEAARMIGRSYDYICAESHRLGLGRHQSRRGCARLLSAAEVERLWRHFAQRQRPGHKLRRKTA